MIHLFCVGFNKCEKEVVGKLIEVAFYAALKGHSFTEFKDQIKLEKCHGLSILENMKMRVVVRILFLVHLNTYSKKTYLKT